MAEDMEEPMDGRPASMASSSSPSYSGYDLCYTVRGYGYGDTDTAIRENGILKK
jgi:hypothetical protein